MGDGQEDRGDRAIDGHGVRATAFPSHGLPPLTPHAPHNTNQPTHRPPQGANRNQDNPDAEIDDYGDRRVCKHFLLGCCPHDVFRQTKIDLVGVFLGCVDWRCT